ncbi:DUF4198 domain-containing protein [Roseateles cavernae]|uniref:DUF4198 domain-containing protein n=1 Tax=Roseateles cavernae TaxID=3153578 RepID=UPI0032E3742A
MLMIKSHQALLATVLLAAAAGAQAHQIWIEQDAAGARLYLGEFGDNLRETSPGMLDKFTQTSATLLTAKGEQAVALDKQASGFVIKTRAIAGESIVGQELGFPSWERKQGDKVERHVWVPAARWVGDFAARAPQLTLDLVPTGQPGQFQVFYKGQPLPEAKVEVVAASGWSREVQADKSGLISVALPWKSAYALEAKHTDKGGVERAGQKFDVGVYVTTLSFSLPQGLESPPPPPAATPAK